MLRRFGIAASAIFCVSLAAPVHGQTVSLAATTVTGRVALPGSITSLPRAVFTTPAGAPKTYVNVGIDTVEAVSTGDFIAAGGGSICRQLFAFPGFPTTSAAAMTESGTTTVQIEQRASCP